MQEVASCLLRNTRTTYSGQMLITEAVEDFDDVSRWYVIIVVSTD
jgi:hypothetical protein